MEILRRFYRPTAQYLQFLPQDGQRSGYETNLVTRGRARTYLQPPEERCSHPIAPNDRIYTLDRPELASAL
jgi:hypothetical protein